MYSTSSPFAFLFLPCVAVVDPTDDGGDSSVFCVLVDSTVVLGELVELRDSTGSMIGIGMACCIADSDRNISEWCGY